jgi:hypothetical protein
MALGAWILQSTNQQKCIQVSKYPWYHTITFNCLNNCHDNSKEIWVLKPHRPQQRSITNPTEPSQSMDSFSYTGTSLSLFLEFLQQRREQYRRLHFSFLHWIVHRLSSPP